MASTHAFLASPPGRTRVAQLPGYEKTSMSPMGRSIARFTALRQWDRVYGKDRTDMPRRRYKPEEIVAKLRQVDVLVSHGQNMADAIRQIGVSEVTFYRMPPTGEDMAVRTVIVARQRRILRTYTCYYNDIKPHRSLYKDAPAYRPVQRIHQVTRTARRTHRHHVRV
jgi:hypothetical protein